MRDIIRGRFDIELLKDGFKLKRINWEGYWSMENDTIMMHCKDGQIIDIRNTEDVLFTTSNILAEDWEIATSDNCEVLRKENE